MGSDGGRALQSRGLEGLCPASLIREAVVGQRPLFIELSLLKGVCAFFFFFCGWGVGRLGGMVVSAKGLCVQRMPMDRKKGTQTGQPERTQVSELIEKRADV